MDSKRQPRSLNFLKCARCRKDHQKCTPRDRLWPSQRCDRCIKFEYPCSASLTARGQSQGFLQALKPVGPNVLVQDWMNLNLPVKSPPTTPNLPLSAEFTASESSHSAPFSGDTFDDARSTPKCAELFNALKRAGWSYEQQLRSAEREPEGSHSHAIKWRAAMIIKASIIKLYATLKNRERSIGLHQMYGQGVEGNVAIGFPREKAKRLTFATMIRYLSEKAEVEEDESAINFTLSIVHMVREGRRWQQLIDAVASPEILLIGLDRWGKNDEEDNDDYRNEIPSVRSLEKEFYKDYKSIDIAKITQSGDDALFAKMKELLMMPDLQLKETCQRLSGLSQLMNRLGEVEKNFNLDNDDDILSPIAERTKHKAGKNSELVSSLCSEISKRIRDVLWEPDSRFESEIDHLLPEIASLMIAEIEQKIQAESEIDGKESSSNDDGSEETCGGNVSGQIREFDEDFCIQFLNSDAFS